MRNRFLIVFTALLLSVNFLFAQPDSFDPEIRKFYLNLDTISGNRLLGRRYTLHGPEYIRLTGYRDFLIELLYQSEGTTRDFLNKSDRWLDDLKKIRSSEGSVQATLAEIHLYRAVLASILSDHKSAAIDLLACYKVVARAGPELSVPDRNKLSGTLGILFQQVPDSYLKYLKIIGVRPSGLSGYNGLERYYRAALPGSPQQLEGYLLMMVFLKEFDPDPDAAWNFMHAEGHWCGTGALSQPSGRAKVKLRANFLIIQTSRVQRCPSPIGNI